MWPRGPELTVIERIQTPRGELQLQKRFGHYEIIFNGVFLMATYNGDSEMEMVRLGLERLDAGALSLKVLVGGLGAGYTVRAALQSAKVKRVDVVEIEPCVIRWNQNLLREYNQGALFDPRVRVINDDLASYLGKGGASTYDLIALDVDNGPEWVVLESNRALYRTSGLRKLKKALARNGLLAVWSAGRSKHLRAAMVRVFGNAEEVAVLGKFDGVPQRNPMDNCLQCPAHPGRGSGTAEPKKEPEAYVYLARNEKQGK